MWSFTADHFWRTIDGMTDLAPAALAAARACAQEAPPPAPETVDAVRAALSAR